MVRTKNGRISVGIAAAETGGLLPNISIPVPSNGCESALNEIKNYYNRRTILTIETFSQPRTIPILLQALFGTSICNRENFTPGSLLMTIGKISSEKVLYLG